jgi:hypothetical protein
VIRCSARFNRSFCAFSADLQIIIVVKKRLTSSLLIAQTVHNFEKTRHDFENVLGLFQSMTQLGLLADQMLQNGGQIVELDQVNDLRISSGVGVARFAAARRQLID